jgi:hypothetical protein
MAAREPFNLIRDYMGGAIVPTTNVKSNGDELLAVRCQWASLLPSTI